MSHKTKGIEFGATWNSGDADLVTGFFAENGVYHASVGPDALDNSYVGKDNIRQTSPIGPTVRLPTPGRQPRITSQRLL
jgi:hypothetical protein